MKMKKVIGVMSLQAKGCQGLMATTRNWERGMGHLSLTASKRNQPSLHVVFGLLASRTVKESISGVIYNCCKCIMRMQMKMLYRRNPKV